MVVDNGIAGIQSTVITSLEDTSEKSTVSFELIKKEKVADSSQQQ